jgi:nitroimidazol reductase NimA-like FMN-containing flavoprotein (pyridoxamine 5'-phosphate oxidase superfamily)
MPDLAARAREVIAANVYMALGTADPSGAPWVSPVYFSHEGFTDFYWVSSPDTLHSRNIAWRPTVAITIYDSSVAIGQAEAVYLAAQAAEVTEGEFAEAADVYNRRLPEAKRFELSELRAPALFRLYRARATEHSY